ncbi:MAG: 50S ribosomal protein L4 [Candidatus Marinimicrobia bacterium]|nr:50S ribosomal protein L4 [Candidatus Neomarinimicrobiota bacterium]
MKIDIYNKSGKKTSKKIDLNKNVFEITPNEHSIYLAVKSELAAKRQGNSHSKNRSEVRGGGAKPWKQKGTGRARIGSTRNPSRVHGGAAFGPQKRSYTVKLNKKTKLLARKSVLSIKAKSKQLIVLDNLTIETSKTKDLLNVLNLLKIDNEKLIILCEKDNKSIYLSSRNMKNVNTRCVESFSTYDIADSSFLLVDKTSVEYLNEKLNS